jgi:glycosyltransferase involved in cell wall biosynthesis
MPDFLVFSGLLPKLFGAKVVLDLHDPVPELMRTIFEVPEQAPVIRLLKWIENWSLWFADSIVTINQQCAEVFISRSCPRKKVTVVMNSPDESIFRFHAPRAKQEGKERFVIMYHGTIVERNGLDLAVDAFARIVPSIPQAELRIYGGRNPYLETVLEQVRKLGIDKSVRYLGPKPLENIVEAIEECDLGIIPNKRNIFTELNTPTRIFEYLALGKPVIAPRAPGITDYFNDESIFFFELGNAEDLARQMEYAFRHPEKAKQVTLRGQEVHQEHTWREERSILTHSVANTLRM